MAAGEMLIRRYFYAWAAQRRRFAGPAYVPII